MNRYTTRQIAPTVAVIGIVGALLWALLASQLPPNWDGVFYYSYARSMVYDQDLQFSNDIELAYPYNATGFINKQHHVNLTESGYVNQVFAGGTALLWAPWLAVSRLAAAVGVIDSADSGYEPVVVRGIAATSMLVVLGATLLAQQVAAQLSDNRSATIAALTLLVATPLLYYQFHDPFYAHAATALLSSVTVCIWWRSLDRLDEWRWAVLLGIAIGLTALMRWQSVIYAALPTATVAYGLFKAGRGKYRDYANAAFPYLLIAGVAALLTFSVQFTMWQRFFGDWITIPQGDSFLDWRALWWRPLLLSPFRGLLAWMPVFVPALIGLLQLGRKRPNVGIPLLTVLVLALYVNASSRDWFAGGGFGPRRLTSEYAIFIIGYAYFIGRFRSFLAQASILLLSGFFAWHQLTLFRYALPNKLGGSVVTMAPDFQWADTPWDEFLGEFGRFAITLFQTPRDFFVSAGSPLDLWLNGQSALLHWGPLLGVSVSWALLLGLGWIVWRRFRPNTVQLFITLCVATAAANAWIYWFA